MSDRVDIDSVGDEADPIHPVLATFIAARDHAAAIGQRLSEVDARLPPEYRRAALVVVGPEQTILTTDRQIADYFAERRSACGCAVDGEMWVALAYAELAAYRDLVADRARLFEAFERVGMVQLGDEFIRAQSALADAARRVGKTEPATLGGAFLLSVFIREEINAREPVEAIAPAALNLTKALARLSGSEISFAMH